MKVASVALVCALLPVPAQAQELGRLFFTPEQRANLDLRRKARMPDRPAAPIAAPTTRVDGYVKRSGGPSTVWINGDALGEGAAEAPRIDASRERGTVSVTVEGGGRVRLKPGETLDRGNGDVRDVLGDGEIRIRPPRP